MSGKSLTDILNERKDICRYTEESFRFLSDLSFGLKSKIIGESNSFKDGFELNYSSENIMIRIEYYDMEFSIKFTRNNIDATYLYFDLIFFENASGLQGTMFSPEKLKPIILKISNDIKANYSTILKGDDTVWKKVELNTEEQNKRYKNNEHKYKLEALNPHARENADVAFHNKDYKTVIKLLYPLLEILEESYILKYKFALKHKKSWFM